MASSVRNQFCSHNFRWHKLSGRRSSHPTFHGSPDDVQSTRASTKEVLLHFATASKCLGFQYCQVPSWGCQKVTGGGGASFQRKLGYLARLEGFLGAMKTACQAGSPRPMSTATTRIRRSLATAANRNCFPYGPGSVPLEKTSEACAPIGRFRQDYQNQHPDTPSKNIVITKESRPRLAGNEMAEPKLEGDGHQDPQH